MSIFCSTIIPTIGRPSVDRSIYSVLEQSFTHADREIIVVNDSGQPLPSADWQALDCVRIVQTNQRRLAVARNTGAALARGRYLHFLDDDDWLLPGAMDEFWQLSQENPAAVALYGGSLFIDGNEKVIGQLNLQRSGKCLAQLVSGAEILVQSALIDFNAFFKAGGYNTLVDPGEETDLWRRLSPLGDFANTPIHVAGILRGEGWRSTCNHAQAAEINRTIRDSCLKQTGSFSDLSASAETGYWKGRVLRVYAASALWNLHQKRLFSFFSRVLWGSAWGLYSTRHIVDSQFWTGFQDHSPPASAVRVLP